MTETLSSRTIPKNFLLFVATTIIFLASASARTEETEKKIVSDEDWVTISALMRVGPIVDVIDQPVAPKSRRKILLAELGPLLTYLQQSPNGFEFLQLRSLQRKLENHEHELRLFNLGTYDFGSEKLYAQTRDRMYHRVFELETEIHDLKTSLGQKTELRQKKPETEQQARIRDLVGRFEKGLISAPPRNSVRGIYLKELRPLAAYLQSDSDSLGRLWRALLQNQLARKLVEFDVLILHPTVKSKGPYFEIDKAKRSAEIEKLKKQIATYTEEQ